MPHEFTPLAVAARDAWIYGHVLIEMALARSDFFDAGGAPNTILHEREITTPANQFITAPNNDTLYSRAWIDLRHGPVSITVPPGDGRYRSAALMDMYSNNFCILGTRTLGEAGGTFTLVGPEDPAPPGAIRSPTPWVWMFLRVMIDGPDDQGAANAVQDGFGLDGPTVATPDDHRLAGRDAGWAEYFDAVQALVVENPPPASDTAFFRSIAALGLRPSAGPAAAGSGSDVPATAGFDASRFAADEVEQIERGVAAAPALLVGGQLRDVGDWFTQKANVGNFGEDYRYRAQIARGGIAALPTAEVVYLMPSNGGIPMPMDSATDWHWSIPAGSVPDVDGFWSLTIYRVTPELQLFLFDNPIDRYSIGDRTPGLRWNDDGGLDVWISRDDPGGDRTANWLPAPPEGMFALALRAFIPKGGLADGTSSPPPIVPSISER